MEISQVNDSQAMAQVRQLFREYFRWLQEVHKIDPGEKVIAAELASLPGEYAPPRGRLLIVNFEGNPAGCGALRPLDDAICEMRRIYVKSAYRGRGIGRALIIHLVDEAHKVGYRNIRIETRPFMYAAQALYRSLGFQELEQEGKAGSDSRLATICMELSW